MKIDELATALKPKVIDHTLPVIDLKPETPITRPDRLIECPAPYSICYPHTPGNRSFRERQSQAQLDAALEAMDATDDEARAAAPVAGEARFDHLTFDPFNGIFRRRSSTSRHTAHLGGVEL